MTPSKSAAHSAIHSDGFSADYTGQLSLMDHGLNCVSADSADVMTNLHTRAHAQNKLEKPRHSVALAALTGPKARAAAYQAWLDAGQPWPLPDDMGAVLDHGLDACAADPMRAKWRR